MEKEDKHFKIIILLILALAALIALMTLFSIALIISFPNSTSGGVGGVVYTRWSQNTCPNGRQVVYTGQVGGTTAYSYV